eukprot:761707-Hanusia_phi.AAC.3
MSEDEESVELPSSNAFLPFFDNNSWRNRFAGLQGSFLVLNVLPGALELCHRLRMSWCCPSGQQCEGGQRNPLCLLMKHWKTMQLSMDAQIVPGLQHTIVGKNRKFPSGLHITCSDLETGLQGFRVQVEV